MLNHEIHENNDTTFVKVFSLKFPFVSFVTFVVKNN